MACGKRYRFWSPSWSVPKHHVTSPLWSLSILLSFQIPVILNVCSSPRPRHQLCWECGLLRCDVFSRSWLQPGSRDVISHLPVHLKPHTCCLCLIKPNKCYREVSFIVIQLFWCILYGAWKMRRCTEVYWRMWHKKCHIRNTYFTIDHYFLISDFTLCWINYKIIINYNRHK
jgi:hypothetical protein